MEELAKEFHGPVAMAIHSLTGPIFWLALAGVVVAWFFYLRRPDIPAAIQRRFSFLYTLLDNKYYFDWFNENVLARARAPGGQRPVEGRRRRRHRRHPHRRLGARDRRRRRAQPAPAERLLYWYALVMIVGVIGLMTWQLWPFLGNMILGR